MAQIWTLLLGTFTVFVSAKATVSVEMELYLGRSLNYSVEVSWNALNKFDACLCNKDRNKCCLQFTLTSRSRVRRKYLYKPYRYYLRYFCSYVALDVTTHSTDHECTLDSRFPIATLPITCSGVRQSDKLKDNVHFLLIIKKPYYSISCLTARWSREQRKTRILSSTMRLYKGSCMSALWATLYPAPTTTASKLTHQRTKRSVLNDGKKVEKQNEDKGDDNTFLIMMLSFAGVIIFLIIIIAVLCGLTRRWTKQYKSRQRTSHHDVSVAGNISHDQREASDGNLGDNPHNSSGAASVTATVRNEGIELRNQGDNRYLIPQGEDGYLIPVWDGYITPIDIDRSLGASASGYDNYVDQGTEITDNYNNIYDSVSDTAMVPESSYNNIVMRNLSSSGQHDYANSICTKV